MASSRTTPPKQQTILSFMRELNEKNKAKKEADKRFAIAYRKIIDATTDLTIQEFVRMIEEADAEEEKHKSNLTKK